MIVSQNAFYVMMINNARALLQTKKDPEEGISAFGIADVLAPLIGCTPEAIIQDILGT